VVVMHHAVVVVAVMVNSGGSRRGSHGKAGNADKNSEVVFHVFRRRLVLRLLMKAVQLRKVVQRKKSGHPKLLYPALDSGDPTPPRSALVLRDYPTGPLKNKRPWLGCLPRGAAWTDSTADSNKKQRGGNARQMASESGHGNSARRLHPAPPRSGSIKGDLFSLTMR